MIDKELILSEIKKHYNFEKDTQFANFLGIKPNTLSSWRSRNSLDYELIIAKCKDISGDWLLTGEGEMLKSKKQEPINNIEGISQDERISKLLNIIEKQQDTINNQQEIINNLVNKQEKTSVQQDNDAECATA